MARNDMAQPTTTQMSFRGFWRGKVLHLKVALCKPASLSVFPCNSCLTPPHPHSQPHAQFLTFFKLMQWVELRPGGEVTLDWNMLLTLYIPTDNFTDYNQWFLIHYFLTAPLAIRERKRGTKCVWESVRGDSHLLLMSPDSQHSLI